MRLKLWVKIALFILITGAISVIVFQMGRKIGMELARENMQKYDWAHTSMQSRFTRTETQTIPFLDEIYEMVGALGSTLPNSTRVATKIDPRYAYCNYCGEVASWDSSMINLGHNWKIKCKACSNLFPSNDFGGFYKLGLVNGIFDYETALNKHHELFGDKSVQKPSVDVYDLDSRNKQWDEICAQWYAYYGYGNPEGYLYNELYADVRESNTDPVTAVMLFGRISPITCFMRLWTRQRPETFVPILALCSPL